MSDRAASLVTRRRLCVLAGTSALGLPLALRAQTREPIRLGQSLPLSGPGAGQGRAFAAGMQLALDATNRAGGIAGRALQLIALDDALQPIRAQDNVRTLIRDRSVDLIAGMASSESVAAVEELLRASGVPLLGAVAVSDRVRAKTAGAAYYVRASYGREIERLIEQMATQRLRSVGITYLGHAGGLEARRWVEAQFAASPVTLRVAAELKPEGSGIEETAAALAAAAPDAVLLNPPGGLSARLIGAMNRIGASPAYFGMSLVPAGVTAQALGSRLRSLVISQVMPYHGSRTIAPVEEFARIAQAAGVPVDYSTIEGYVTGLVAVDALRRAGANLSSPKLHAALRAVRGRFCGVDVSFAASPTGSRFVELVHVDGSGRIVR